MKERNKKGEVEKRREKRKKKSYSVMYPGSSALLVLELGLEVVEEALLLEMEVLNASSSTCALLARMKGQGLMRKGELLKESR